MKKMLKTLKPLIPAYILAFCLSFMLFIYEPINLYATNIEDFWFDFYIMIFPVILLFIICFLGISLIYMIIYFLNKKYFKKMYIYNFCLLASFVTFVYLYIQGNYLIGDLPALDGSEIVWENYLTQNIISIIVLTGLIGIQIVLVLKLKLDKCVKIVKYVSLAIVAMLTTSLISLNLTTNVFIYKETPIITTDKNLNLVSSNKNFLIFLVDSVDSVNFNELLSNSEIYKDIFKDFTYYPDTLSGYAFTRDSIPFILSGVWNENEMSFTKYSSKVLNESKFLNRISQEGYNIGIYEEELKWEGKKSIELSNSVLEKRKTRLIKFFKQEIKYALFKYLPYSLKKYSSIQTMSFNSARMLDNPFNSSNGYIYNLLIDNGFETIEDNVFHFIHAEGGHVPFNQDENLNEIENGTYDQKLLGTLKLIDTYLKKLKESKAYDNSVIIVISDHGYNVSGDYVGRQNPILYIKGIDENHNSMKVSDKAISFEDLQDAYFDLLDGKSSRDLFKDIGSDRERRFILYRYTKEKYMYEYIQTGKAWDEDTLTPTGKEFILD